MGNSMEHPILFNGDMVRAILDGRKTQTRRVIKPQPLWIYNENIPIKTPDANPMGAIKCPYGSPGDRLWVRETWAPHADDESEKAKRPLIFYRADGDDGRGNPHINRWRPSIHMPRWASRILLAVKNVRVERVQDISEEDADAEGFGGDIPSNVFPTIFYGDCGHLSIPECFGVLWDSINAKRGYGWDKNPWCWCVEFGLMESGA